MRPTAAAALSLRPPARLDATHDLDAFDCGDGSLDDWLKRRARRNEREGASRTYVVCAERRVVAYYCLASGSIMQTGAPGRVRRNMPDPIPVMVLGRLAVDRAWQGKGLAAALLADAIKLTLRSLRSRGFVRSSSMRSPLKPSGSTNSTVL